MQKRQSSGKLGNVHAIVRKATIEHVKKLPVPKGFEKKWGERPRTESEFVRRKYDKTKLTTDQAKFWIHFMKFEEMVDNIVDELYESSYNKADMADMEKIQRFRDKWCNKHHNNCYLPLYTSIYNSIAHTVGLRAAMQRATGVRANAHWLR